MKQRVILLLNTVILAVNFVVALQATETQTRVLRTTARIACEPPPPIAPLGHVDLPAPPAREKPQPAVPFARLTKFLANTAVLDGLDAAQVAALEEALRGCCADFSRGIELLRGRNGEEARVAFEELRHRAQRRASDVLRSANVPEGEALARLARIVVASAG